MVEVPPWVEWICHSNFSFLTGASYPEDYVQRAHDLAYAGLGMTDYDGVYGIVRAYRRHSELVEPRTLRLFYGSELHLAADHTRPIVYRDSIVLLALNMNGYRQLNTLISFAHRESKSTAVLPLEHLLAAASPDLICLQPMRGLIRRQSASLVEQRYRMLREAFGRNFFLVISRHLNPAEDQWIPLTLQLSKRLDIPYICSQDSFFHEEKSKEICDILHAIRLNQTIDTVLPHLFVNRERCLHAPALLQQRYQGLPGFTESMQTSLKLMDQFRFTLQELKYQYPQEMIPFGYTAQTYLEKLTWDAVRRQNPTGIPPDLESLLIKELRLIDELDFGDYFLTVWDIVHWARAQDILCQGRGSAANSGICYVLGITAVDPTRFDVLFERFISRERGEPPDIDVDFEHERREEVIQYIYQRYGRNRAAMVANIISFRSRSALRMVGKALGIPLQIIEEASRSQTRAAYQPEDPGLPSSLSTMSLDKAKHTPGDPVRWALWQDLAQRINGFPRHMGIHSGGFVLNHEDLAAVCPLEPATMPGRTIIQWAKDDIESLNIFKIDVLALGMLTVLRKALLMIRHTRGIDLTLDTIPADDPETYKMIQRGDTVGTFQIESRAQMSMLPRLLPQKFYDLVVQVGIIRPGPIQGGMVHPYLRRRQGLERIEYPDPRLKGILERTLGVPIFQEQVMRIAITVGYFSPGEADQLRKQIGSWAINKNIAPLVKKLEIGMRKNGVEERFIKQILGHLEGFAHYGFPESHAISFALLAYSSSYLKCHYKEAFYTALLNSQPVGFYSIHALVQTARREGILFRPIDINRSAWDSQLEPGLVPGTWIIRLGLQLVRGLSRAGSEQLLNLRERQGPWSDLFTLLRQNAVFRIDMVALAAANALQGFGMGRSSALWIAEAFPLAPLLDEEQPYNFGVEEELQAIDRDFEAFATTLGQHPSQLLRERHWAYDLPQQRLSRAVDLRQKADRSVVHVFGLVLVRQAPETAKGMEFFTLEDETGFINLAFTPQIAERYSAIANRQGFLCVTGRLQREGEGHSILVQRVHESKLRDPKVFPLGSKGHRVEGERPEEVFRRLPAARNFH